MTLTKVTSPAGITWWEMNGVMITAPTKAKDIAKKTVIC